MSKPFDNYMYKEDIKTPQILAYGFRPVLFILPFFIILLSGIWILMWLGFFYMPENPIAWHIYENLFGIGSASLIAFLLTAIPELYKGVYPIVGKHLAALVVLWILGRISFWMMDFTGVYLAFFLNVGLLLWLIAIAFKPVVLDKYFRHTSIAIVLVLITIVQICYFLSLLGTINIEKEKILTLSLGLFMVLIIVALRRVNTEAINFYLEEKGVDEVFYARAFRYNIAIFSTLLYTFLEFYDPDNKSLIYIGFACGSSILGILSDFKLKDYFILHFSYVINLGLILILMAIGYFGLSFALLFDLPQSAIRHFLTTGAFGLSIYMTMVVIVQIHTGRKLKNYKHVNLSVFFIVLATFLRFSVLFYAEFASLLYTLATIFWLIPFILYMKFFSKMLLEKRVDGLLG